MDTAPLQKSLEVSNDSDTQLYLVGDSESRGEKKRSLFGGDSWPSVIWDGTWITMYSGAQPRELVTPTLGLTIPRGAEGQRAEPANK